MGYEYDRFILAVFFEGAQNYALVYAVHVACRLVQKQQFAAAQKRAGKSYPLLFSRGEIVRKRRNRSVISLRKGKDKVVNTRHAASPLHLLARGVGFCDKQIFKHRFVEKISALADHCHFFYKRSRVYFVYGNTVVVYLSAAAVPEAEHKFQKRTLSAPRSAHYTYGFTLSDIHVDAFEHLFAAVRERKVLYVRPFQCYVLLPFHRLHGGLFFEKVKHSVAAGERLVEVVGKRGYRRYGAERAEHRHNSDYRPANGQIARKHERDRHGERHRNKEGYDQ